MAHSDNSPLTRELSTRDKGIIDMLIAGHTEKATAEAFGLSQPRVNQIRQTPAAVVYTLRHGGNTKALVYSKVGAEILKRLDWGGVKLTDLIAIWKAAMPQELAVSITDRRAEAVAIAAEIGKADDAAVVAQIERDLLLSSTVR